MRLGGGLMSRWGAPPPLPPCALAGRGSSFLWVQDPPDAQKPVTLAALVAPLPYRLSHGVSLERPAEQSYLPLPCAPEDARQQLAP